MKRRLIGKVAGYITYSITTINKTYGDMPFTNPISIVGDGTITYSSSNTTVATVNQNSGQVTVVKPGVATITATVADSTYYSYETKNITYTLNVAKAAGNVSLPPASATVPYTGNSQQLVTAGSGTGTMMYKLNNGVWSVDIPTAINHDTYTIYYKASENDYYTESEVGSLLVTIPLSAPDYIAPTERVLVYNGNELGLLSAGSTSDGTFYYSTDNSTWNESVPKGTNAGTYTVYWKLEGDNNHTSVPSTRIDVTIDKAENPLTATKHENWTYDGESYALVSNVSGQGTITYSLNGGSYTSIIPQASDAGTYVVKVKATGNSNYYSKELSYTIVVSKVTPTVTVASRTVTYNRSAQNLITSSGTNWGTLQFSLDETNWSASIPTATNVGTYQVYYKVIGDSNINDIASTAISPASKIEAKSVTADITLSYITHVYTGEALTPTVTAKDGTTTIPSTEYTVSYSNNTNAGTATITLTDKTGGNYIVTGSTTFTITKADGRVDVLPTNRAVTYTGEPQVLATAGSGTGTMYYSLQENPNYTTSIPSLTNAGTYTMLFYAAESDNYTQSAVGSIEVTISKADPSYTAPTANNRTYDTTSKALLNAGSTSHGTIQYSSNNSTWGDTIPSQTNAGTYTTYWKIIGDSNHNDKASVSITTTISPKTVNNPTITLSPSSYIYSGNACLPTPTVKDGSTTIASSEYTVSYSNNTNAGTATCTITDKTGGNYTVSGSKTFTISKVTPTVTAPTANDLTYTGNALALVTAGSTDWGTLQYSTSESGTYSTTIPTGTNVGNYEVWYKVVGNSNINDVAAVKITITIKKANPTYTAPTAKTGLIYNTSAQALLNGGSASGGTLLYSSDNSSWSTTIPTGTNVGSYTSYWRIVGDSNHNDKASTSISTTISAKTVSSPTITLSQDSYTYNGSECKPTPTVKDGTVTIPGSEYTVSYSNNINAGTATCTITDTSGGNYTVSGSKTFTINKANCPASVSNRSLSFTNSALDLVTVINPQSQTIHYRIGTSGNFSTTIPTATNAGTYTIQYYIDANSNYLGAYSSSSPGSVSTTIAKVNLSVTEVNYSGTYDGSSHSSTVKVNSGGWDGKTIVYGSSTSYGNTATNAGVTGTAYALHTATNYTESTTIYYKITGGTNHNDYTDSVTFAISKKSTNAPVLTAGSKTTYDGNYVYATAKNGSGNPAGTIYYGASSGSTTYNITASSTATNLSSMGRKDVGSTTIYAFFRPTDTTNYLDSSGVSTTVTVSNQANGYLTATTTNRTYNGSAQTIASIATNSGTYYFGLGSSDSSAPTSWGGANTALSATTKGTYYVWAKCDLTTNYKAVAAKYIGTVTVSARTVTITAPTKTDRTYTGSAQTIFAAGSCTTGGTMYYSDTNKTFSTSTWSTALPYTQKTNAGTYTLYYYCYVSDTTNNTGTNINTILSISAKINQGARSGAVSCNNVTYGSTVLATVSVSPSSWTGGTVTWGITNGTGTATINSSGVVTPTKVGTVTVTATVGASGNYAGYTATSKQITISLRTVTPTAPTATNIDYSGSAQTIFSGGSCTAGGTMYYSDTNKTFSTSTWSTSLPYTLKTDAGTYTIYWYCYVSDTTNNTGTNINTIKSVSATINKVAATLPGTISGDRVDTDHTPARATVSKDYVGGTLQYSTDNGSSWSNVTWYSGNLTANPSTSTIGDTNVKFRVNPDGNHTVSSTSNAITLTVIKSTDASVTISPSSTLTYTGSAQTIATASNAHGIASYYIGYRKDAQATADNQITWNSANTTPLLATNAGDYYIYYKFTVDSSHSGDKAYTYVGKVTINKKSRSGVVSCNDVIYGSTVTASVSGNTESGTITWGITAGTGTATISGGIVTPTKVGTVTVTASVAATANYAAYTATSKEITISQRTVTWSAPTRTNRTYNGSDLTIFAVGSCTAGGTMKYSSDNSTWSTSLPYTLKKEPGTYTIYYKCEVSDTTNNKGTNINTSYSLSATISKISTNAPVLTAGGTTTYTGTTYYATAKNGSGNPAGTIYYGASSGSTSYSLTASSTAANMTSMGRANVGTTTIYAFFRPTDTSHYLDSAGATTTVTITNKATGSSGSVSNPSAQTYKTSGTYSYQLGISGATGTVTYPTSITVKNSGGTTISGWSCTSAGVVTVPLGTNAGSYTVTGNITVATSTNYNAVGATSKTWTITINKAAASISYATTSVSKTYGDGAFTNTLTKSGDGTVTYASNATGVATVNSSGQVTIVSAGSCTITATVTDGTNYTYATKTASYSLSIGQANGSGTVTMNGWVYGGTVTNPTPSSSTNGTSNVTYTWYNSSKTLLSSKPGSTSSAGTYYVKATFAANTNYKAYTTDYVSFSITLREVTLTWGTRSWTYDKSAHSTTCTAGNLVSGDTCTVTLSNNSITNVGSVTVTASSLSNSNYKLPSTKTTTISIGARTVTLTWGTTSWTYDKTAHSTTCTAGNLCSGDSCTVTLSNNSITNVGSVTVTASGLSNSNYTLPSSKTTTISITAKGVTVSWGTLSWTYDKSAHSTTCSISSGVISGDTCNVTLTGNSVGANVGTATVSASLSNSNYTISSGGTSKTLTISARTVTLTWGTLTWTYDKSTHSTTCTAGNLCSGDSCTVTLTGNSVGANVGTATVTASSLSNSNYTLPSSKTATLTINARTVTLSWGTTSWTYDKSTHSTTCTAGNLCSGDSCTVTLTGNSVGANVGTATVTASSLSNSNYTLPSSKTATLSVVQKEVTLSWGTLTWTYDGSAHSTTCTAGSLCSGDSCTVTLTGNSITNKGTTTVTASSLSNSNYKLPSSKTATLTINARATTVTAGSNSKTYDGTALTYSNASASNLASGHTLSSYSCSGSITDKGSTNNVPSGAIIKSGSADVTSNYSITYANGTLTINARPVTYKANDESWTYDGNTHSASNTATLTSGSLVSGHTATFSCTGSVGANVGTATKTLSSVTIKSGNTDLSSNYSITRNNGTLSITRARTASASAVSNLTYNGTREDNGTPQRGVTGSNVSWTGTTSETNAGSYTAYATPTSNYAWSDGTYDQKTISWSIARRGQNPPTLNSGSATYPNTASASVKTAGTIAGGTATCPGTLTWSNQSRSSVGSLTATAYYAATTTNFSASSSASATVTVSKYTPTVTLSATDRAYNGSALYASATVSSPSGGLTPKGTIYYGTSFGATTYSVAYSGSAVNLSSVSVTNYNNGSDNSVTVYAYFVPDSSCNGVYNNSGNTGKILTITGKANLNAPTATGATTTYNTTATATATGGGGQGTLTWTNGNTQTSVGTKTTKAYWAGNGNYYASGYSNEITLTMKPRIDSEPTDANRPYSGSALNLLTGGTASPSGGTWSYSLGINAGSYTATWTYTLNGVSVSGSKSATILKANPSITATPTDRGVTYSRSALSLLTGGTANVNGTFSYSSGTNAGSYDGHASAYPKATWTFTPSDTTNYNTVSGQVNATIYKCTPIPSTLPTKTANWTYNGLYKDLASGGAMKHSATDSTAVAGTFSYASACNAGTYLATYSFTPNDTTNYISTSGNVGNVTVNKATGYVGGSTINRTYNGYGQIVCNITSYSGTPYIGFGSSSSSGPSSWSQSISISATNAGTYYMWAKCDASTNYTAAGATYIGEVTVAKANRTISFTSAPNNLAPGTTATLAASPSAGSGDGTITYYSSDTSIATVSGSTITGVRTGTCTISAVISAGTNYNSAQTDYVLKVTGNYLAFVAKGSGTFTFTPVNDNIIYYKLNQGSWTQGNSVNVSNGDTVYWKGTLDADGGIGSFSSSVNFDVKGNIMSLLYGDSFEGQTSLSGTDSAFDNLFGDNTKLISAGELILPATTLDVGCYTYMFKGCTSLTTAPSTLPATTLATSCYESMFEGCSSLTTTPTLPATTISSYCYKSMFKGCYSLTTAPSTLPATTLADNCYEEMFRLCISLTTAPSLPATTLAPYCYSGMFRDCAITTAPELPATTLATSCYNMMFAGGRFIKAPALPATTLAADCYSGMFSWNANLIEAPELPATTLANYCYNYMFDNCHKLSYVKAMFTTTPGTSYTNSWLKDVASSGTFIKSSSATWNVSGINGVPSGWRTEKAWAGSTTNAKLNLVVSNAPSNATEFTPSQDILIVTFGSYGDSIDDGNYYVIKTFTAGVSYPLTTGPYSNKYLMRNELVQVPSKYADQSDTYCCAIASCLSTREEEWQGVVGTCNGTNVNADSSIWKIELNGGVSILVEFEGEYYYSEFMQDDHMEIFI